MPLLAADIGNTNITLGFFDAELRLTRRWSLTSDARRTPDEYRLLLRELTREFPEFATLDAIVVGSVVPVLSSILEESLQVLFPKVPLRSVTALTPMRVRNGYPVPSEVGIDRLANAVGGFKRWGAPIIVADFGTATTLDVVDAEPCYLGGVILPGPRLAAEALNLRTARLPMVSPHPTEKIIAASTVEAIRSGLFWGMVGSIDYLVERAAEESGFKNWKGIATGGLGRDFVGRCRTLHHYDADLTLCGLAEIWRDAWGS